MFLNNAESPWGGKAWFVGGTPRALELIDATVPQSGGFVYGVYSTDKGPVTKEFIVRTGVESDTEDLVYINSRV